MPRLLHISDFHCGPPFQSEVADALVAIAPTLEPDVIVVTGDFTQRAKPNEFEQARALLNRLPDVPRVYTPGNHDVPLYRIIERLRHPFENYSKGIQPELDGALRLPGLVIVHLNSTNPHRAVSNGRLVARQLDLCESVLRDAPEDAFRVLATHHHFIQAPDFARDTTMPGAKSALDRLIAQRVDLILGGHLHRSYIGNSLDVYAGADPAHGIIIAQCGATTSSLGRGREREKNSFNLIDLSEGAITIAHYMHFRESGGFEPISRHLFPRPSADALPTDFTRHADQATSAPASRD